MYKNKTALILGGGGGKAYCFHIGVLKNLTERGFTFLSGLKSDDGHNTVDPYDINPLEVSTYIGSSAGSFVCALLANGADWQEIYHSIVDGAGRYPWVMKELKKMRHKATFASYVSRMKTKMRASTFKFNDLINLRPLFHAQTIADYLEQNVLASNDFRAYKPELYIIATQLNHARKVIFSCIDSKGDADIYDSYCAYYNDVDISKAVAASCSIPTAFQPYGIKNKNSKNEIQYSDGEIRETLSPHVARDQKCDFAIISSIYTPYIYTEKYGDLANYGVFHHLVQALTHTVSQKTVSYLRNQEKFHAIIKEGEKLARFNRKEFNAYLDKIKELLNYHDTKYLQILPDSDEFEFIFGSPIPIKKAKMHEYIEVGYNATERALKAYDTFIDEMYENTGPAATDISA